MTQISANNRRGLVVTTARRIGVPPNVQAMTEAGLPGYEAGNWGDITAPVGTSKSALAELNAEILRIRVMPYVRKTKWKMQALKSPG